jgi:type II secretion system protein J
MELLIATAACAVVLAAIFSVFSRAIHLRDNAVERTREARVRNHAANVIRNDLRNAWISGKKLAIVLKGSRESQEGGFPGYLKFTTTSAVDQPNEIGSEVQQVEYYIVTDAAAADRTAGLLVRAVDRNLLAPTREKPPEEALLPGVESMEVSFFDGDSWKDSWEVTEDNTAVPQAIKVRLQPAGASTRERKPAPIEVLVPWTTQVVATAAATPTPAPNNP